MTAAPRETILASTVGNCTGTVLRQVIWTRLRRCPIPVTRHAAVILAFGIAVGMAVIAFAASVLAARFG